MKSFIPNLGQSWAWTDVELWFWSKVDVGNFDECWEWTGSLFRQGHGQFSSGRNHGLSHKANRTAYLLVLGPIPEGLHVLHACDNRPCCNPMHLYAGTPQDNMDDMISRSRQAKGSKHGNALLTENQVVQILQDNRSQQKIA